MMRMLGPGRQGGPVGGTPGWSGGSRRMRAARRPLPCCLFWSFGGQGRVRLFFFPLTLAGREVVGVGGRKVGRRGT